MIYPMDEAKAHAAQAYPEEACGIFVNDGQGVKYRPCKNVSEKPTHRFRIHPGEWLEAEKEGKIVGFFHSHPDHPPFPSEGDRIAIDAWKKPMLIHSHPSGEYNIYEPSDGVVSPLLGREFIHGKTDCFGLARDYYLRMGVWVPDFPREPYWWKKGKSLFKEHFVQAGFVEVKEAGIHDMVVMSIDSDEPNHGGIMVGGGRLLHHVNKHLSMRVVYGEHYRKLTTMVLRHRELC